MTLADSNISDPTVFGLSFNDVDNGTIRVDNTTIDGNPANAGAVGVSIVGSNATFTFDSAAASDNTVIQNWGQTDFVVDGGTPHITFNGSIVNTDATGRSVIVRNTTGTGGSVSFSADSSITDDNQGLLVDNNTNTSISFLGTHDFDTTTFDAVTVTNNKGTANVIFDGLDITTTSGRGVFIDANATTSSIAFNDIDVTTTTGDAFTATPGATGGGNLSVSGDNNVITTTTGKGLVITGMNIQTGASFESVTVTNGATTGIALSNVTGAQVTVGETTGGLNSGGTLTTAGDAIQITNTTNVDLNHMRIANAGGKGVLINQGATATTAMDVTIDTLDLDAAADNGIEVNAGDNDSFALRLLNSDLAENVVMTSTGSGHFGLLVDSTDITTGNVDAFALNITGPASSDITLRNGNTFIAGNAHAMIVNSTGAGHVGLLVDDTDMTSGNADTLSLNLTGAAGSDITIRNGNNITALDGHALFINANASTSANSKLLINGSFFTNTSATLETADITSQGATSMDATVQSNTFRNNGAGAAYHMTSDGAAAGILLNLGGTGTQRNTGISTGATKFLLEEANGSTFEIFQRDATIVTDTKNIGAVDTLPNDAAFTDSGTTQPAVPAIPVVP